MLKKITCLLVFVSACLSAQSQETIVFGPASDGTTVFTCDATLFDTGGPGPPSDYGNDEDYTITICPDTPGENISLIWSTMTLDCTDLGDPASADHFVIYDGPDDLSPVIATLYCADVAALDVYMAGFASPTGCLTIQFISNAAGTGSFSAQISCEPPCDPGVAAGVIVDADNIEGDSIAVCVGEEITFDDAGSTAGASGLFVLEDWVWKWQDGTDNDTLAAGDPITHAFSDPGLYVVQLEVIDDNGCSSNNLIDLYVFVSTYPTFDPFPDGETICMGEELILEVVPDEYPTIWDGFDVVSDVEDNCMPDLSFKMTPLNISGYDSDIELSDAVPDILEICVDIEHSYMGDFILQVQCPTGQTMTLHEQLGGGTYLGIPVDGFEDIDCDDPDTYGVPWHYCFTSDAAETWEAAAPGFGTSLPEGDYLPITGFDDLDGCPINGEWNLIFTDLFGADDGSIASWEINFADYLAPDVISFTPTIGAGADSSYWEPGDPSITDYDPDGDIITILHDTPGFYDYTYHIVNSFGCGFDSTITFEVVPPSNPFAGLDDSTCFEFGVAIPLEGTVEDPGVVFEWSVITDPGILTAFVPGDDELITSVIISEAGIYDVLLTTFDLSGICGDQEDTVTLTLSEEIHETELVQPSCSLDDGEIIINSTGLLGAVEYSMDGGATWQVDNVFTGLAPGIYTVTSRDAVGCSFDSEVELEAPDAIGITVSADTLICENGSATVTAEGTGGADYVYNWAYGGATIEEGTGSIVIDFSEAPVTVDVFVTAGTGCISAVESIEITVRPPIAAAISPAYSVCPGDEFIAELTSVTGGDGVYSYSWTANGATVPFEAADNLVQNPVAGTEYCVTITDGCETSPVTICTDVSMFAVPNPTFTSDVTWGCEGAEITFTNTTAPVGSFTENTWSIGGVEYTTLGDVVRTFDNAGEFDVDLEVVSVDGCVNSISVSDYITIYAPPTPSFYATPNPTTAFNPNVEFINNTTGDNTYEWFIPSANIDYSTDENPEVIYPEGVAGIYEVKMIATDENGCHDSLIVFVSVLSEVLVYAPNIFTPDGDQFNETWRVYIDGIDIYDFHLTMFNRWGEIVWESFNAEGVWDGTYGSGGIVQDGTYVWVIETKDASSDKKYRFDGSLQLMK